MRLKFFGSSHGGFSLSSATTTEISVPVCYCSDHVQVPVNLRFTLGCLPDCHINRWQVNIIESAKGSQTPTPRILSVITKEYCERQGFFCQEGAKWTIGNRCTDPCGQEQMDCGAAPLVCSCFCVNGLRFKDGLCVPPGSC